VTPGLVYNFQITADAAVRVVSTGGTATVVIDPFITFAYADDALRAQLVFNEGVGNTPAAVPGPTVGAGASSFALATLFLGWLVRRRGHQMV
jgi:hypothetical protein